MKQEPFMMRRVLCALDLERSGFTSLSMASLLAEHFNASIDALYATPTIPMFDSAETRVERLSAEHNAQERLTGMLAAVKRKVAVSPFVTRGDATSVILTHSERQGSDLIVMASSPHRRLGARPGTIAPVAALAPCAVLTVGDRFQPASPRRILLPIGPAGAERDALSWASALASRFDAEVGVLRVGERRSGAWTVFSGTLDPATNFGGAGVLAALCARGIDAYEIDHPGGCDADAVGALCESGGFDAVVMGLPAVGDGGDADVFSVRLKTSALVLSVRSIRSSTLFAPRELHSLPKAFAGADMTAASATDR